MKLFRFLLLVSLLWTLVQPVQAETGITGATFLVGGIGDTVDTNPGDGVCSDGIVCTFRAAIMESNALTGQDTIQFNTDMNIFINSQLPPLSDSAGTIIFGGNHTVSIIKGSAPVGTDGLIIETSNNKVQGLMILGFDSGIQLAGNASYNFIGSDGDGLNDAQEINIIGANVNGVDIYGDYNKIMGNYIGVGLGGETDGGNSSNGVIFRSSAVGNWLGVFPDSIGDASEHNLISGNNANGVYVDGAGQNYITGNYIGLNAAGTTAIPNTQSGIYVGAGSDTIIIGLYYPYAGNIISGNTGNGIRIVSNDVRVQANTIGLNAAGTGAVPNGSNGVLIEEGSGNIIGTNGDDSHDASEGNTISGNTAAGVRLSGEYAFSNAVMGNAIGTDRSRAQARPNGTGISIANLTSDNRIGTNGDGTSDALEANIISGNNGNGIEVVDGPGENTITGNLIGLAPSGLTAIPNVGHGIVIESSYPVIIGGNTAALRNVITANGGSGIYVSEGDGVIIQGNYIGTNINGSGNIGNDGHGIWINYADNCVIGGTASGESNRIFYNDGDGIFLPFGSNNDFRANKIQYNGEMGIDIGTNGVTANDSGDADTGANGLQNYPVLSAATADADSTTITGTLNSKASQTFTLDFYYSLSCDASGYGEGTSHMGSMEVTTNASGNASFAPTFGIALQDDYSVTVTATGTDGTSEFSACRLVERDPLPPLVVTHAAGSVTTTSASLSASINPFDTQTTAYFQLTTTSGNYTSPIVIAATPGTIPADTPTEISGSATGLTPGTPYFYRAVATNSTGTTYGNEMGFITQSVVTDEYFLYLPLIQH